MPYHADEPTVRMAREPTLVTSFTEFERAFGGLDRSAAQPDLPRPRRPGLLRQRRSPALRLAGLPVPTDAGSRRRRPRRRTSPARHPRRRQPAPAAADVAGPLARGRGLADQGARSGFRRSKNILVGAAADRASCPAPPSRLAPHGAHGSVPGDADTTDRSPTNVRIVDPAPTGSSGYADGAGRRRRRRPPDRRRSTSRSTSRSQLGDDRVDVYTGLELGTRAPPRRSARCCRRTTRPTSLPGLAGQARPAAGSRRHRRRAYSQRSLTPCWPAGAGYLDRRHATATRSPRQRSRASRPTRTTPERAPPGWTRSARSTTSRSSPCPDTVELRTTWTTEGGRRRT